MTRRLLIGIFLAVLIAGCYDQRPVVLLDPAAPCEEIVDPILLSVPFDEVAQGREQAEEWIVTQFPTATVNFEPSQTRGEDEIGRFAWLIDAEWVSLILQDGNRFILHLFERSPTLGQVIRCFGKPEYYNLGDATIGGEVPSAVLLRLWYPDRGLFFESETWGSRAIREYDVNSPLIGQVRIMPPGTVEEMAKWGGIYAQRYITEEGALLRKWPEHFTKLGLQE